MDDASWLAWTATLTVLGAVWTVYAFRNRGAASGLRGAFRIEGLGAIYGAAMRVWLKDETDDLSKTMAELDKRLGQAERCLNMTQRKAA